MIAFGGKVTLTNLPVDFDLKLYNSAGTLLKTSANAGTTAESAIYNNGAVGTYYVQVYGYNGANSATCYTLNATIGSTTFRLGTEEGDASDLGNDGFSVYPNPVSGMATLHIPMDEIAEVGINVFDLNGRKVLVHSALLSKESGDVSLDMSNLNEGMYFIQLTKGSEVRMRTISVAKQ